MPPKISVHPAQILADGYDSAIVTIENAGPVQPRVWVEDPRRARVEEVTRSRVRIRAGVVPGRIRVHVDTASIEITALLDPRDTAEDGTPDFLRLGDDHDRQAFRRWFTWLAEAQYFQPPAGRPAEIVDCAALIRYAYREALHAHDGAWASAARLPLVPAFDSVAKYRYPYTPLAADLFRATAGPFRAADLTNGAFRQFADARTLWRRNTHLISRELARALPGDLLFFRQGDTFHSMIYLGESYVRDDGRRYVLYHTGPEGSDAGELRRLTVDELLRFPRAQWRPLASNPGFLGVARWNILREGMSEGS